MSLHWRDHWKGVIEESHVSPDSPRLWVITWECYCACQSLWPCLWGRCFWKRGVTDWNCLNHNHRVKVLTDPFFYVVRHNRVKWIIVNEVGQELAVLWLLFVWKQMWSWLLEKGVTYANDWRSPVYESCGGGVRFIFGIVLWKDS